MYIYIYIYYVMKVLLHASVYLYNLQGVLYFYFAKVTKIIKIIQHNKFSRLKFLKLVIKYTL